MLKRTAWQAYRWLADLLMPPCCVSCGRLGGWLCADCAATLPLFVGPLCVRCGRAWEGSGLCPVCRETPLQTNPIRAAFLFEGAIRDVIHALKYRGGADVVATLAPRMREAWLSQEMSGEVLIPVPLHAQREAQRGYNQAALLAVALGREMGLPVVGVLQRVRNTTSQTKLNRRERRANVAQAFTLAATKKNFQGKHVVLVDDVATTGATLEACAITLLQGGAKNVSAFTLARAS
ncbi:MAG: ComF family protein [Chloroflexota bacterium]|nr:ComF family protein [Chloroflexota bacterium]